MKIYIWVFLLHFFRRLTFFHCSVMSAFLGFSNYFAHKAIHYLWILMNEMFSLVRRYLKWPGRSSIFWKYVELSSKIVLFPQFLQNVVLLKSNNTNVCVTIIKARQTQALLLASSGSLRNTSLPTCSYQWP